MKILRTKGGTSWEQDEDVMWKEGASCGKKGLHVERREGASRGEAYCLSIHFHYSNTYIHPSHNTQQSHAPGKAAKRDTGRSLSELSLSTTAASQLANLVPMAITIKETHKEKEGSTDSYVSYQINTKVIYSFYVCLVFVIVVLVDWRH